MKSPTCNFELSDVIDVASLIRRKIDAGLPFSLVRLGDGEGALLALSDNSTEQDRYYFYRHLGPVQEGQCVLEPLQSTLRDAIAGASIVGVRDDVVGVEFPQDRFQWPEAAFLEEFRSHFRLRDIDLKLPYEGARRIAFLHRELGAIEFSDQQQFCSAWIQYDLHTSGLLFDVIGRQDAIGLISCRKPLTDVMQSLFEVKLHFHHVPAMYRDIREHEVPEDYLDQMNAILDKDMVKFPGMLFLVGAGLFGKVYCEEIRKQGGVALDVGSLLDAWLGIESRPAVYKSKFPGKAAARGVPDELLLNQENIRRFSSQLYAGEFLTEPSSSQ